MADAFLNYADRETLRPLLVPRIKQGVIKFLLYIAGGGGTPSDARKAWAIANLSNAQQLAEQISPYMMSEPGFLGTITRGATTADDTWTGGTSISSDDLQSRIEQVLPNLGLPA